MTNQNQKKQALEILQKWYQSAEYQKIIDQGKKFLELEPESEEINRIVEMASQKIQESATNIPTVEEALRKKKHLVITNVEETSFESENQENAAHGHKNKFIGLLLVAILLIAGGIFFYQNSLDGAEKSSAPENSEKSQQILEEKLKDYSQDQRDIITNNLQRNADLQDLKIALETYYSKYKRFPAPSNAAEALLKEKILVAVPRDPRHKEKAAAGQLFGYTYSLFDNENGKNQGFAVTVLFEGLKGSENRLSSLSNSRIPEGFKLRDLNAGHTVLLEYNQKPASTEPPQKVKRK